MRWWLCASSCQRGLFGQVLFDELPIDFLVGGEDEQVGRRSAYILISFPSSSPSSSSSSTDHEKHGIGPGIKRGTTNLRSFLRGAHGFMGGECERGVVAGKIVKEEGVGVGVFFFYFYFFGFGRRRRRRRLFIW